MAETTRPQNQPGSQGGGGGNDCSFDIGRVKAVVNVR